MSGMGHSRSDAGAGPGVVLSRDDPPPPAHDIDALMRWAADRPAIDFDEDDKREAASASAVAISVYVCGQLLAMYVILSRSNSLTRSWQRGERTTAVAFFFLTAVTNYLYWKVARSDPGFLPSAAHPDVSDRELSGQLRAAESELPEELREGQRCQFCRLTRPLRAKHCHKCGRCVAKYDHHCFWLWNCVGTQNHSSFWWLLLSLLLSMGWGNLLVWSSYRVSFANGVLHGIWADLGAITASVLGISMWLFVAPLFVGHCGAAVTGVTTWEFLRRERITYFGNVDGNPFDAGLCGNLRLFFCSAPRYIWRLPVKQCSV